MHETDLNPQWLKYPSSFIKLSKTADDLKWAHKRSLKTDYIKKFCVMLIGDCEGDVLWEIRDRVDSVRAERYSV